MHDAVRVRLIAAARAKSLITYTELGKVADLDVSESENMTDLGKILDEIAEAEVKVGRPLLAAVVVRADTQCPRRACSGLRRRIGS